MARTRQDIQLEINKLQAELKQLALIVSVENLAVKRPRNLPPMRLIIAFLILFAGVATPACILPLGDDEPARMVDAGTADAASDGGAAASSK